MIGKTNAISAGGVVVANPTLEGGEPDLTGLEVDGVKYAVPSGGSGGSSVVANPTLAGTEAPLKGLEVDGVKYSNKLYKHECYAYNVYFKLRIIKTLYSRSATPFNMYNFGDYIYPANSRCELTGTISVNNVLYPLIYSDSLNIYYLKDGRLISNQRVSGSQIDVFYDTVTDMTNI